MASPLAPSGIDATDFAQNAAEYLEMNEVHDLFLSLLQKLILARPEKPLEFLIESLKEKPSVRVCVVGPPGHGRQELSAKIAKEFGVDLIKCGELLQKEQLIDSSGQLSVDSKVTDVVLKALGDVGKTGGWVLDGFPRTKIQANALQRYLPDKLILVNTSRSEVLQQHNEKDGEGKVIGTKLEHHYRHLSGIIEVYKNILAQINGATGNDAHDMFLEAKKAIHLRPYSVAPHRPPRICVLGSSGSGRSTQGNILAQRLGSVRININSLLSEKKPTTEEEICAIVGGRLQQVDCLRLGWTLIGFPKTPRQAEYLKNFSPTRVVFVDVNETICLRRLSLRRVDPVTGTYFTGVPSDPEISTRLLKAEHDKPEIVRVRHAEYTATVPEIRRIFDRISIVIDGDNNISDVSENVESAVIRPIRVEPVEEKEN